MDLPALLRGIHDVDGERVTADEMLTIVALASGGADLVDGRAETVGLMRIVTLLRVMLAGIGPWREGSEAGAPTRGAANASIASAGDQPRVATEVSIEQLCRQLSHIERRIDQLEPALATETSPTRTRGSEAAPRAPGWAWAGSAGVARRWSLRSVGGVAVLLLFSFGVDRVMRSAHAKRGVGAVAVASAGAGPAGTEPSRFAAALGLPSPAGAAHTAAVSMQPTAHAVTSSTKHESIQVTVRATGTPLTAKAVDAESGREFGTAPTVVPVRPAEMERNLVTARKPVFPPAALARRMEGTVVLNTFIAKNGSVSRMDVVSGQPPFIDSAMAAVSWRHYRPYLLRGRPVAVVTPVTVTYHAP